MNDGARILGMLEASEVQVQYAHDCWLETDELAADERIDEAFQLVSDAFEALRDSIEAIQTMLDEAQAA